MKHLTNREEEIMEQFWDRGPLFINDILKALGDLKLHYNTVSTVVRGLEDKGFVDHEQFGNTYRYFPVISRDDSGNDVRDSFERVFYGASAAGR